MLKAKIQKVMMCFVKLVIPCILKPLKHIFNNSLQKGVFLESMKIARVIPIVERLSTQKHFDCSDCDTSTKFGTRAMTCSKTNERWTPTKFAFQGHHIQDGRNEMLKYISLGVSSLLIKFL